MSWQPLERSTPYYRGRPVELDDEEQYANDKYVVNLRRVPSQNDDTEMIHLSIRRQDRGAAHDWRDFQRIKNELAGPEWEAVEIYPAESRLVDAANQYHLWCFPFQLGFGFRERLVGNQYQADTLTPGAKQRDPEKVDLQYGGLTKLKEQKERIDQHYLNQTLGVPEREEEK